MFLAIPLIARPLSGRCLYSPSHEDQHLYILYRSLFQEILEDEASLFEIGENSFEVIVSRDSELIDDPFTRNL